ncbi:hypothetical protein ACHAPU_011278 [Fusarium lateritium]
MSHQDPTTSPPASYKRLMTRERNRKKRRQREATSETASVVGSVVFEDTAKETDGSSTFLADARPGGPFSSSMVEPTEPNLSVIPRRTSELIPDTYTTACIPPTDIQEHLAPGACSQTAFTQNNRQTINQNTYNYHTNKTISTYASPSRWSSFCGLPLPLWLALAILLFIIWYGITSIFHSATTTVSDLSLSIVSVVSGFTSYFHSGRPPLDKPEPASTTILTTPIIPAPSGLINALSDSAIIVSQLGKYPELVAQFKSHDAAMRASKGVEIAGVGDELTIVVHDIIKLQRGIVSRTSPVYKAAKNMLDKIEVHPAMQRWEEQDRLCFFLRIWGMMPWVKRQSYTSILLEHHARLTSITANARHIRTIFPASLHLRLTSHMIKLSSSTCSLLPTLSDAGNKASDAAMRHGVSILFARQHLLCDTLTEWMRKLDVLDALVQDVAGRDDEGAWEDRIRELKVIGGGEGVRELEEEWKEVLKGIKGSVERLRRLDLG